MLPLILILAMLVVYGGDELASLGVVTAGAPERPGLVTALTLGAMALVMLAAHVAIALQARALSRTGNLRAVRRAEAILAASRLAALAIHLGAVLGLGWVGAVRAAVGDLVLLDEALALAPLIASIAMGWWSIEPIDRRLREASLVRDLDEGRPVYPLPGRARMVWQHLRHQTGIILVPVLCIMAWLESADRLAELRALEGVWRAMGGRWPTIVVGAAQIGGALAILAMMPVVMRVVWDTVKLGPGPLRDRLEVMCRAERVRVADLLVWRTGGVAVNGAVLGFLPRMRYVLLTDALIDHLSPVQIEAVMAHEIGHIRRRHMPWLAAASIAAWLAVTLALAHMGVWERGEVGPTGTLGLLASLVALVVVFGAVSRAFERQADAFALRHLTLSRAIDPDRHAPVVTAESADAMSSALALVADLNHVRQDRFTWRHGSVAARRRLIDRAIGEPLDRIPGDRGAQRAKAASLVALVLTLGALALELRSAL